MLLVQTVRVPGARLSLRGRLRVHGHVCKRLLARLTFETAHRLGRRLTIVNLNRTTRMILSHRSSLVIRVLCGAAAPLDRLLLSFRRLISRKRIVEIVLVEYFAVGRRCIQIIPSLARTTLWYVLSRFPWLIVNG